MRRTLPVPPQTAGQIVNVMKEERIFPPPADFAARARIQSPRQYDQMYREAAADLEGFWGKLAAELHWFRPYTKLLDPQAPITILRRLSAPMA
jgi:acetyl-CoA synthetase